MKKTLLWRICFIIVHKLAWQDHTGTNAGNCGYWPPTSRMKQLWGQTPFAGGNLEFPLRLYRRLRKCRNDIRIITAVSAQSGPIGPAIYNNTLEVLDMIEAKFKVRYYCRNNEAYIVGVRGEIGNLWR